jgi:hypothetical protein
MRPPNDRAPAARPPVRRRVSRHPTVVRTPHRRPGGLRRCGRRTSRFPTRVEAPPTQHPCGLRVVRDSSTRRAVSADVDTSGNVRTRMDAGDATRRRRLAQARRRAAPHHPPRGAFTPAERRVSRPIGRDRGSTGSRRAGMPTRWRPPRFPESSRSAGSRPRDRTAGGIAATVRETADDRAGRSTRPRSSSHVGNHRGDHGAVHRRRRPGPHEAVQRPNEDRRRTDRTGGSATFRPLPEPARTAPHASSRHDDRPAITPTC